MSLSSRGPACCTRSTSSPLRRNNRGMRECSHSLIVAMVSIEDGDALYLYEQLRPRQGADIDHRARRKIVAENFLSKLEKTPVVTVVGDEGRHRDDIGQLAAGALERLGERRKDGANLAVEISRHRFARSIARRRGLAGEPHRASAAGDNGLRIGIVLREIGL